MPAVLVIGNKNYSSWSLRAWLALRHFDIPFEEERIALDQPDSHERILRRSPAGRVPVLVDGDVTVWDSLAIAEYASERWLGGGGWPDGIEARAVARSVSAEMHAGFAALRAELPMNCRAQNRKVAMSPAARADVARVTALLADCRRRFGGGGPWLFGGFSVADAMYAPVAFRFATYGVRPGGPASDWCEALLHHPRVREWAAAAAGETEIIAADEAGEAA